MNVLWPLKVPKTHLSSLLFEYLIPQSSMVLLSSSDPNITGFGVKVLSSRIS